MQFEFEGNQYVFSAYHQPMQGEIYINWQGKVRRAMGDNATAIGQIRLILKPLEIHHTFGMGKSGVYKRAK